MTFNRFSCIGIKRPGKMTNFNFVRILWYYKVLSLLKHVAVAGKPNNRSKNTLCIIETRLKIFQTRKDQKIFPSLCIVWTSQVLRRKKKKKFSNKLSRYFFGFIFRKKPFSPDLHFVRQIQPFSININFLLILNFNACHSNEVDFYNIISFELP